MNDFFQENKRFLVTYVVGALAFLVAWLVIDAIFSGDIRASKQGILRARQEQGSAVAPTALRTAKGDLDNAQNAHAALVKSMHRVPANVEGLGELRLTDAATSPDLYYNAARERIRTDELERCAVRNIDVDQDLGLPDAFPTTRREIDWYLRGLDIVRQVLKEVLRIDAEIAEGGIARIDRVEIAPPPKARPAAGQAAPYIIEHKVTLVAVGSPQAVFSLAESLGRKAAPGRFLQVSQATVRSLDLPPGEAVRVTKGVDPEDTKRVEARLELVALEINPEGAAKVAGKSTP